MTAFIAIFACAAFVLLLLWAEKKGDARLKWIAKPAASLSFVALAIVCGAATSSYGLWVLTALVLCFLGDVFLIPKNEKLFLAGMGAFAAGHAAFIAAFLSVSEPDTLLFAIALGASVVFIAPILRWLWPHLGAFQWPVAAYCAIIGIMVAASPFAAPHGAPLVPVILAGAIGFAISDISVARDQFVKPQFINKLWGLPLYYGAQLLLASSV